MQTIGTGRYLCLLYYRGELKPSATYKEQSAEWLLARCVEIPLERNSGVADYWRQLMSGDLVKQKSRARYKLNKMAAGGRANFTGVSWKGKPIEQCASLDGSRDELTIGEVILYKEVGDEFVKMLRS